MLKTLLNFIFGEIAVYNTAQSIYDFQCDHSIQFLDFLFVL